MKRLLFVFFVFISLIAGIFYYISNQKPALDQPIIPQEDEVDMIEEKETENSETTEETTEQDEDGFTERLSLALQETMDRIFKRELNIVAIGDSLTRGVGDSTGGGGYVGILERTLNQENHIATFENLGVPGNRSDQLLNRLSNPEVEEKLRKADTILITIGANDIMQVARENMTHLVIDDFIAERSAYERRLERILDTMQAINVDAEIYLLGIYNPFERFFQEIEELDQIVDAWNETGSDLAEEREDIFFIPIADLFSGNEDPIFAQDNFHPNYAGYYLMAERVLDYISREEG